jgi:hypothetical protein
MPLRDHFHPPLADRRSWEGVHGLWPGMIVVDLNRRLPDRYVAEPRVHLGSPIQVDVATDDKETNRPRQDEYGVRVYDTQSGDRLVAAVEIVSPANKDRPEHRRAFMAKCEAWLQNRVCVMIVDLVTDSTSELYRELFELLGQTDPSLTDEPSALHAVACRLTKREAVWLVETWMEPLSIGQPLPTLPLWLTDELAVPVDLESSYEETCRVLRLP